jgi:hypothetical protein
MVRWGNPKGQSEPGVRRMTLPPRVAKMRNMDVLGGAKLLAELVARNGDVAPAPSTEPPAESPAPHELPLHSWFGLHRPGSETVD